MNNWSETLPEQCPPEKAFNPAGLIFYRLCEFVPPTEHDFKSQRANCPSCDFKLDECIVRSLSVWNDVDKCLNLLKLPRHKGKMVVKVKLTSEDGLVLQTFKPNHYSWWRTKLFDVTSATATP